MKERKFQVTLTERQLHTIIECVEDCHRFMAGDTALYNMTCRLDKYNELHNELQKLHHLVTPELADWRANYRWSGGNCPNDAQRKFIAETYCLYREMRHQAWLNTPHTQNNCYDSETLTCDEGGPLPKVKLVKE